jgi:hypothetical protein
MKTYPDNTHPIPESMALFIDSWREAEATEEVPEHNLAVRSHDVQSRLVDLGGVLGWRGALPQLRTIAEALDYDDRTKPEDVSRGIPTEILSLQDFGYSSPASTNGQADAVDDTVEMDLQVTAGPSNPTDTASAIDNLAVARTEIDALNDQLHGILTTWIIKNTPKQLPPGQRANSIRALLRLAIPDTNEPGLSRLSRTDRFLYSVEKRLPFISTTVSVHSWLNQDNQQEHAEE